MEILAGIIGLIALIVFFVMAHNLGQIKDASVRQLNNLREMNGILQRMEKKQDNAQ